MKREFKTLIIVSKDFKCDEYIKIVIDRWFFPIGSFEDLYCCYDNNRTFRRIKKISNYWKWKRTFYKVFKKKEEKELKEFINHIIIFWDGKDDLIFKYINWANELQIDLDIYTRHKVKYD